MVLSLVNGGLLLRMNGLKGPPGLSWWIIVTQKLLMELNVILSMLNNMEMYVFAVQKVASLVKAQIAT